jgi:hypothetical protein
MDTLMQPLGMVPLAVGTGTRSILVELFRTLRFIG